MHFLWSGTISSICLLLLEHIYVRYVRQVITNNPDTSKPSYCAMDKSGVFFFKRKVSTQYFAAHSWNRIFSSKYIFFCAECQRVKWQSDEELLHPRVPGVWVGTEDDRQPPASPCWPAAAQAAERGRLQPPASVQLPHQVPQLQDRPLQRQIRPDGGPAQGGSRCDQASSSWPLDLQLDNSIQYVLGHWKTSLQKMEFLSSKIFINYHW